MENAKNGTGKTFKYKPLLRMGIAVLVLHTVCWLGWNAVNRGAESSNAAATANAQHERLRAAIEQK
ncbi:uncharacterized protein LOC117583891 [Drosophila guanche]|uniref:Uncharacterized protein n=1 Tax=Drosophila guanche TaxID=7266 RepID=A0A3B0JQL1_DROGU|nr:uncharacterized protein LOC117583891 [Drosophila guanche]SPP74941.1 Hypothetical predicted protein [Drosophila guanche]